MKKGGVLRMRPGMADDKGTEKGEPIEWEMRPGGMLVQKREDNCSSTKSNYEAPNCRIRVTYGTIRYDISLNSQSTFGELKKLLSAETGLQPGEQKLIFRGKERENGDYLDMCGVKNRSKIVLIEDPSNHEKRYIEMRRNAKIQSANRAMNGVSMEVDKLAEQVCAIEKSIASENKVAEVQITTLIEMLMRLAIKLDTISAEGDATVQRNVQSRRVQKCVETLDVLKVRNAKLVKPVLLTSKWGDLGAPSLPAVALGIF